MYQFFNRRVIYSHINSIIISKINFVQIFSLPFSLVNRHRTFSLFHFQSLSRVNEMCIRICIKYLKGKEREKEVILFNAIEPANFGKFYYTMGDNFANTFGNK